MLLGALSRLVERARKNDVALLDRLEGLVSATKSGYLFALGPKQVVSKQKARPANGQKQKGENKRTWAQVVGADKGPQGPAQSPTKTLKKPKAKNGVV